MRITDLVKKIKEFINRDPDWVFEPLEPPSLIVTEHIKQHLKYLDEAKRE